MKLKGYMGSLLEVDLTKGTTKKLALKEEELAALVGGKGLGTQLFLDTIPKGAHPLGEENVLMFLTGPLTGTMAPATRSVIVTKSPLTNTWLDSYYGGCFGQEIKYAGYDGILIKGRAPSLSYLHLQDGKVHIKEGEHLKNKGISETQSSIQKECPGTRVAAIGPAGENQVRYALISCEPNRQAGRGGAGAVMGSKNLKALAVTGSSLIPVHHPQAFLQAVDTALQELRESDAVQAFTQYGTPASIPFAQEIGSLPTRNYSAGTFTGYENLSSEAQRQLLWFRNLACSSCPIACGKIGHFTKGKYRGILSDTLEYESLGMLGSNLQIQDIQALGGIISRCDDLGLDTISTGGTIGFAMEALEKGFLKQGEGEPLTFGNAMAVYQIVERIAHREGELANLLAEGVQRAARQLPGSEAFAVHVKGLETPAWSPRGLPAMGLAYMTGDRGGCHQRGFPLLYETGEKWKGETLSRLAVKGKAQLVVELQNYLAALDTFIKCDFGTYGIKKETYIQLLNSLTGLEYDVSSLMELGGRVWDLTRHISVREGYTKVHDTLPPRFTEEPLPDGPEKGHRITRGDIDIMLGEYYALRGWNEEGIPPGGTHGKDGSKKDS